MHDLNVQAVQPGLVTREVRSACAFKLRSSVVRPPLLRKSLNAVWKSCKNEIWLLQAQKSWFSQLAPFSCLHMLKSFIFGVGWIRLPGFACLKILRSTCPKYHEAHSTTGYSFSTGWTDHGFDLVWLWLELAHCHCGCFFIAACIDEYHPVSQEPRF